MMEIHKGTHSFYIGRSESEPDAEIVYEHKEKGVIVIERTFVSEALRGRNIAGELLRSVVDMARKEGLKIIPECTYAQKAMNRGDEYRDVLYVHK